MKNFPPDTQNRLLAYIKPHLRILTLGLICAAATSGITASIAWFHPRYDQLDGKRRYRAP